MSVNRRHLESNSDGFAGAVSPNKLQDSLVNATFMDIPCSANWPIAGSTQGTLPTGANGTFGRWHTPHGGVFYKFINTVGPHTTLGPTINAISTGKTIISLDETATWGVEYVFNDVLYNGTTPMRLGYIVGTSAPMRITANLEVADVSGAVELAIGFRKAEAVNDTFDNYTDVACLNVQVGTVNQETILNNAATVTVDTGKTWADAASHEIVVEVGTGHPGLDNSGRARFFFDGEQVGTESFVFDTGDYLTAFIHHINAGVDTTAVLASKLQVAYIPDIDDSDVL